MEEIKHALRSLGKGEKITRIMAQSLLKTIKQQNKVNFLRNIFDVIFNHSELKKDDQFLVDISVKLIKRNIDDQFLMEPEIIGYVVKELTPQISKFINKTQDMFEYNREQLSELFCIFIRYFEIDFRDVINIQSNQDKVTDKQISLVRQLIKSELILIETEFMFLRNLIKRCDPLARINLFIDIVLVCEEGFNVEDLFSLIFSAQHCQQEYLEGYLRISDIEPIIYSDHLNTILMWVQKADIQKHQEVESVLRIFSNVYNSIKVPLNERIVNKILDNCLKLVVLKLKQDSEFISDDTMAFIVEFILSIDQKFKNKKQCQSYLIQITQDSIINDKDKNVRQGGILMLLVLSRYLDTSQISEIYPLVIMVMQMCQFYKQDEAIVQSVIKVLKYILTISDHCLFEYYGLQILQFLHQNFNLNQLQVQKEVYFTLIVFIKEMGDSKENQNDSSKLQLAFAQIANAVYKLMNDQENHIWLLNSLQYILKQVTDETIINKLVEKVLDSENKESILVFSKIAINQEKNINKQNLILFNMKLHAMLKLKMNQEEVLKSARILLRNDIFSEILKSQQIYILSIAILRDQIQILSQIDLQFDLNNSSEQRFNQALASLRQSLKNINEIIEKGIKIKIPIEIKLSDITLFIELIKVIQKHQDYYAPIKTILSKLLRKVFFLLYKESMLQEARIIMQYYFIQCLTSQKLIQNEKIQISKDLIHIILNNHEEFIENSISPDLITFSQILLNQLNISFKLQSESLNQSIMNIIFAMIQVIPYQTVSLQNVMYNQYIQKTLKNNQPIKLFKTLTLKFLYKVLKYSMISAVSIMYSSFEVFLNFMTEKDDKQLLKISIKGLNLMVQLSAFTKTEKDIKTILQNIQAIIIDNQIQSLHDQMIYKILANCINIVNVVLKQLISGDYQDEQQILLNIQTLLSYWLIHIINLEKKSHDNYDHIETFIHILTSNHLFLIGKNNQNLSGILKILSLSLTEYCFENDVEVEVAEVLLEIQTQHPMIFIMAMTILDSDEKQFINRLIEKKSNKSKSQKNGLLEVNDV
ncbi:UNKNOWN [Stylonychia lemnae]|uniref:Uncharacterized protein n=1 Tax=Stylonychia lemnae TaxID=5949 RepID=A0A078AI06_STYLE|nr:UNKNOWN [Stylonychia lemnae]|eukprot:CDW81870.1 UNKNOWN [Stylonychia lemnae]